jgi:hypothetical protein
MMTGTVTSGSPSLGGMLICTTVSLALGLGAAWIYMFRNRYNQSFVITLVLLPAIVQIIVMLVNGNLGAGVAVAGAFSLVRFRSLPGNARDIGSLFFAMAMGFVTGMGYLFYAVLFFALIGAASLLLTLSRFGGKGTDFRTLKITIPENLDYDGLFEDIFAKYTLSSELDRVRTTNMGSLYELTYLVRMKSSSSPKAFIDELRCNNGNLNITLGRELNSGEEL